MSWVGDLLTTARGWLHDLLLWVESFAATPYGVWALFAIALVESSLFPVPPDVLLIALCLGAPELSMWFALVCTVGSVLGGALGYGIGKWGGRPVLRRLFNEQRVQAVEAYYDRYNAWATGIAGLTPIPYKIFTIGGGVFAVNFKVFMIASLISRGLRFFAVAAIMQIWGAPMRVFIEEYLGVLTIAFVVLFIFGVWLVRHGLGRAGRAG
jgi:membrane protein YqaA with SNARE-associated domain